MVAEVDRTISLADITGQKRYRLSVGADIAADGISRRHTVGQAVEFYLDRMGIRGEEIPFIAFSRGVRLDSGKPLEQVPDADSDWTVVPEVSAG